MQHMLHHMHVAERVMVYRSGTVGLCRIVADRHRVHSPGGSTLSREMTSWPPSL